MSADRLPGVVEVRIELGVDGRPRIVQVAEDPYLAIDVAAEGLTGLACRIDPEYEIPVEEQLRRLLEPYQRGRKCTDVFFLVRLL